nr:SDR family NAD(P)-dependent oxidoreductase [Gammaproteobacteria bacterium]
MTSVSPDLTGEIALITGCAGLLGPVHADALIRCGAFVVVTDIDEERALQTAHRLADEHGAHKVIGLRMDVTDRAGVAAVQRRVLDEHGCVGVLVNNAAIDPKVDSEGGGR